MGGGDRLEEEMDQKNINILIEYIRYVSTDKYRMNERGGIMGRKIGRR